MDLKTVQERIIQNKIKKGFNTTDIEKEFRSLQIELDEALDAFSNKSVEDVAEELADFLGITPEEVLKHKQNAIETLGVKK